MNEEKKENKIVESQIDMESIKRNKGKAKKKKALSFKPSNVRMGIIYSEILGKPKSRRG